MSDDGPSMEELREGSTFGDRDDPNAASPYDGDADDDPDDDSIREDLIDRIGDKVSGRRIGRSGVVTPCSRRISTTSRTTASAWTT